MLAVQGPRRARSCRRSQTLHCPARMTAAVRRLAGTDVLVCGTGYTGEDGVELLLDPADAPALWDELCAVARSPPAWPRATRCVWRPVFTCTATTSRSIATRSKRVLAGVVARIRTSSARRRSAPRARPFRLLTLHHRRSRCSALLGGPPSGSSHSDRWSGHRHAKAIRSWTVAWSRAARSRPAWALALAWPMFPPRTPPLGTVLQIDVRGKIRSAIVKQKPLYRKAS